MTCSPHLSDLPQTFFFYFYFISRRYVVRVGKPNEGRQIGCVFHPACKVHELSPPLSCLVALRVASHYCPRGK
ncbi:hypothetical protein BDV27DRAFT_137836 [Aspergillus caelatus]|uniref:Uncharacterized protein n=1 Tax=Aspergillus caelatus TaxID=61420 RepID=A0A5N6ZL85_9EURO|nr:uncharacterized protein BDV27DRAFT_137836 [Aspergillus caelatus]KAE8358381.1 hypothetical protein BDV27DRAFT_137836 [Aspergillus caelatus]